MANRLFLDWGLTTSEERKNFLDTYIPSLNFTPNQDELETLANYILWGKNEEGQNIEQEGLVELPRKYTTWSAQNVDSLDELTESPTFNENSIYSLNSKAPTKKIREVFSREDTRKTCPAHLLPVYEALWAETDQTDLLINFYELLHNKREKEPRASLLKNFTDEEINSIKEKAKKLNQFTYLKLRHHLVELRREQYTIKDTFSEKVNLRFTQPNVNVDVEVNEPIFEADVEVFPLGLHNSLFFKGFGELNPENFTEKELNKVSELYWEKEKKYAEVVNMSTNTFTARSQHFIDFTDLETVYQLLNMKDELEEAVEEEKLYSTTSRLLHTLNYYINQTELTEIQEEILEKKINKEKNQDIAIYINRKYGKSYTPNYISTIFRQKIIPSINETAAYHKKIVGALFFKEEFKVCVKCKRSLLRDPINFVKKSRAKDGFSNQCKCCDKQERKIKKEGLNV